MENSAGRQAERWETGLSLLPASRARPGGSGSGAAPRDPRLGRCRRCLCAGLEPGEAQEESGGAERVRRGGAGGRSRRVPEVAARVWLYLLFLYFSHFVFHLSLWGLFFRSGDSRKAAAKGGIPAGPPRVCPPPVWWRGRGLRAPRGERRPWVCGEVLGVPPGLSFPGELLCPGCRASADPRGDRGCKAAACAASSSALRPGLGCSLRGR